MLFAGSYCIVDDVDNKGYSRFIGSMSLIIEHPREPIGDVTHCDKKS